MSFRAFDVVAGVCIDREPTWGTEFSHNVLCKLLDTCFSTRATEGDTPVRQYALLDLDRSSVDLAGIQLMSQLTDLTPRMIQILGQGTKVTTTSIMDTTTDKIRSRWIWRGISPELVGNRPQDPPVQPWTYIEQQGTPQQDNFTNTTETRLACGIYTVLSSLYAVRNWETDFVQQTHIRQARNWMAAIGHAIHEVVSLHRCRCRQSYEQWGNQPTPPCPTCEKIRLKNTGPGKRKRENNERTDRIRAANVHYSPPRPDPQIRIKLQTGLYSQAGRKEIMSIPRTPRI